MLTTAVELDAAGTARIDAIRDLAPGSYTVAVRRNGNTYKGTVLKR